MDKSDYAGSVTYNVVLFDLDYTLFDSAESEHKALTKTLRSQGIEPENRIIESYRAINQRLWKALELQELDLEQLRLQRFEELVQGFSFSCNPRILADTYTSNLGICGAFYPEAKEVLQSLAGHLKLGLVTNGVSETQRTRLALHNFDQFFDAIVISGEFGIPKPDSAIFEEALRSLNHDRTEDVLMVGDSLSSDMAGAINCGIGTCWFNPKNIPLTIDLPILHTIHSLDQLPLLVPL
jgi:YjjG family noncanonical pyrimidine nucleotidase